jgi:amino acid adenylation domain-containing protein
LSIPNKKIIHTVFESKIDQFANNIAVEYGNRHISYQELNSGANKIALCLKEMGIKKDTIVGITLESSIEYIVSMIGVMKAGGIFLPLDMTFPESRINYILNKTAPEVIITEKNISDNLSKQLTGLVEKLCSIIIIDKELNLFVGDDNRRYRIRDKTIANDLDLSISPDDSNYIIYTSGSTGEPKAIVGCHKSLSHFIHWEIKEFGLDEQVKVTQLAPVTFDASLRDIFVPLLTGGTLCIPEQKVKNNIRLLIDWLENSKVTLMHCVPSLFRLITKELESIAKNDALSRLKCILIAGEALYGRDIIRWMELIGSRIELVNMYGPSETTLIKTFHRIKNKPKNPNVIVNVGQPIANTAILIIKRDRLCEIGETGKIYIKTPFMTKGYFNAPEMTDVWFLQNPLHHEYDDIVYKTGDIGRYLPNRSVEFIGRLDTQVKVNGIRIELGEIEKALTGYDSIDQVLVIAHKNKENENILVCYYTEKNAITSEEIRAYLDRMLPGYMIPSFYVKLDEFPLNINGKIDRKSLPKPEKLIYEQIKYVPPTNDTEEKLAKIWGDVLDIKEVGVNSSFFEIGGHSLKAMRIISGIYRELKVEVTLKELFENTTIRKLAKIITGTKKSAYFDILPLPEQPYYELSHAQHRLWIIDKMQGETGAYSIPIAFTFTGKFNLEVFEQSIREIIKRHESLRTVFLEVDGKPVQKILKQVDFRVGFKDLTLEQDHEQKTIELLHENTTISFDLNKGPLLRIIFLKIGENKHIMLFNIHHIICDRWSLNVLVRELCCLYEQFIHGKENSFQAIQIQYKDYAAWQNRLLTDEKMSIHRKYWHEKFSGEIPVLELPYDFNRPSVQSYEGDLVSFNISFSMLERLYDFNKKSNVSLFISLLAIVKVLLYRYTGQSDVIVGSVIAGRNQENFEHQIGLYMNVLAYRDKIKSKDTYNDFLQRVRQTALEAYEHQIYPFDSLVEELDLRRDLGRSPLFDVAIDLQNSDDSELSLEGITITPYEKQHHISKYDLFFFFIEGRDGLTANIVYNTNLFLKTGIERMGTHLVELMESILNDSSQNLNELNIVSEEEQHRILYEFNDTITKYADNKTIINLFEEQVEKTPLNIAVVFGKTELTYQELNQQANKVAHFLRDSYHIQPEDRIALLVEPSENIIIGILGIMKVGGAYVPVDPGYPSGRINFILKNSDCKIILTEDNYTELLSSLNFDYPGIILNTISHSKIDNPDHAVTPNSMAYVIYTSGSTGEPKGVMVEHGGFINMIQSQIKIFGIKEQDRVLQFASLSFDASMSEIFMALLSGASLLIIKEEDKQNREVLLHIIKEKHVTTATFPPTYLRILGFNNLKSLRTLITAGERAISDNGEFIDKNHTYWNAYGPTEYSVCATCFNIKEDRKIIPIGSPIANTEILILNNENQIQPIGVSGEICLSGFGVARGYLNKPELTNKNFIPHPLKKWERMYRTGDFGRWLPDGNIEYLGRKDEQVKVRGYRIEPGEIEKALDKHHEIDNVYVTDFVDKNDSTILAAYYSCRKLPELWPSIAEFFIYDDVLYGAMARHEERNIKYTNVFKRMLQGKTVVEIGPGPEAILSRFAIEAGAKKVYAIEYLRHSYEKACEKIHALGLEDRIILIQGDATKINLPEKVDFCISEIVGAIGGSEGSAKIINAARRFLHNPSNMIPQRSITKIAAMSLPKDFEFAFSDLAAHYVKQIFDDKGYCFDLRLCLNNISKDYIISDEDIFENLDYTSHIPLEGNHNILLKFQKDSIFHGFIVWLTMEIDVYDHLDILDSLESWLPVYLPVHIDGISISKGDYIEANVVRQLSKNGINPDYRITGKLIRSGGEAIDIDIHSFHDQPIYRNTPFYKKLFENNIIPAKETFSTDNIREFLKQHIPEYLIPQYFIELEKIPLTSNGKIDRNALPNPEISLPVTEYIAPRNKLEKNLVCVWEEVLGRKTIGINDNFFNLGGNSLHAVQMISRIISELSLDISIKLLFTNPTIAELSKTIEQSTESTESTPITETFKTSISKKKLINGTKDTKNEVLISEDAASPYIKTERRSLISLFACNKLEQVNSVSLACFSYDTLESMKVTKEQLLSKYCSNLPIITRITECHLGRIGSIFLPIFSDELFSQRERLINSIIDALEMARTIGARTVSLTGFIPSATDYGKLILSSSRYRKELPKITTGHATVVSTITLTIEKILEKNRRSIRNECVGFLGLGSIGTASIFLMLKHLPHPRTIILCDTYQKLSYMENIKNRLIQEVKFKGNIKLLESKTGVPEEFYKTTLIVGTINVPNILEIAKVRPGTLIIGDFPPHCFNKKDAIKRCKEQGDILFTEGDVLKSPQSIFTTYYLPDDIELSTIEKNISEFYNNTITGCVFSSLLSTIYKDIGLTIGEVDLNDCVQHYQRLINSGFESAELHCEDFILDNKIIKSFREK